MKPTLYIVAGPIGNLGDITLRALETIKSADLIVAEDTRVTRKLLDHYKIDKSLRSLRERSSDEAVQNLITDIKNGGRDGSITSIAYLTDAGTPGVSDPGGKLVAAARAADINIVPIPGPSSLTCLVQISGVNLSKGVLFLGFLPKKKGRQTIIDNLKNNPTPIIIFEDKHRIAKTLQQFASIWPEAEVVIGRELTKKFEQIITGDITSILNQLQSTTLKGEFTVLIRPGIVEGRK